MLNNQSFHHKTNKLDQETIEIYAIAYGLDNNNISYEKEYACAYEQDYNTLQDIQISL